MYRSHTFDACFGTFGLQFFGFGCKRIRFEFRKNMFHKFCRKYSITSIHTAQPIAFRTDSSLFIFMNELAIPYRSRYKYRSQMISILVVVGLDCYGYYGSSLVLMLTIIPDFIVIIGHKYKMYDVFEMKEHYFYWS